MLQMVLRKINRPTPTKLRAHKDEHRDLTKPVVRVTALQTGETESKEIRTRKVKQRRAAMSHPLALALVHSEAEVEEEATLKVVVVEEEVITSAAEEVDRVLTEEQTRAALIIQEVEEVVVVVDMLPGVQVKVKLAQSQTVQLQKSPRLQLLHLQLPQQQDHLLPRWK